MKTKFGVVAAAALSLAACGGLPRSIREEIASENDRLQQASKQLERSEKSIKAQFPSAPAAAAWPVRLRAAHADLDLAANDRRELDHLEKSGGKESIGRAEALLSDERHRRQAAVEAAEAAESQAAHWLDFERNTPRYLAKMQSEYDAVRAVDLSPVERAVQRAEQDWPAKKEDLDARLSSLRQMKERAETQWQSTDGARHAGQPPVATLIPAEDALATESAALPREATQLQALTGQLYDAWDKVLEDLDSSGREYREKVKIVRTHFIDVPEKKTETSTDVKWLDVSPSDYRRVENDLGMAIGHKDAGLYDSEAQNVAQPAGFAYIASPSVGSNQYGYWSHTDHGSFWTFLPQYLIMRELFWGRGYQPIVVNEYNSYYTAQRSGRSYYGQETPAAPPKYGSHGTFTEQHYAGSRYVQSGGFKGSSYSSQHGVGSAPAPSAPQRFGSASGDPSQGRRFGHGSETPAPAPRRFGSGGSRPAGRSFGRRR